MSITCTEKSKVKIYFFLMYAINSSNLVCIKIKGGGGVQVVSPCLYTSITKGCVLVQYQLAGILYVSRFVLIPFIVPSSKVRCRSRYFVYISDTAMYPLFYSLN